MQRRVGVTTAMRAAIEMAWVGWQVIGVSVSSWWSSGMTALGGSGGSLCSTFSDGLLFDRGEDVRRGTVVGGGVDRGVCGDVDVAVASGEKGLRFGI